jgi:hypothetical protein
LNALRRESEAFEFGLGRKLDLKRYLRTGLWAGGFLVVATLVACLLWVVLAEAGDQAGSQGAKGVALVGAVCLVLDLITLVVLLALGEINRMPTNEPPKVPPPIDKPPA